MKAKDFFEIFYPNPSAFRNLYSSYEMIAFAERFYEQVSKNKNICVWDKTKKCNCLNTCSNINKHQ